MFCLAHLLIIFCTQIAPINAQKNKWTLDMVYNVHWNISKNYLAVHREQALQQFHEGKMHLGSKPPPGMEYAEMSFFYGVDQPNMLIRFKQSGNGAAFCEFGKVPEDFVANFNYKEYSSDRRQCLFRRRKMYKYDGEDKNSVRLYAFCPIPTVPEWHVASGIYNKPSRTPSCIYDFYHTARDADEYNLLRYCAKAYFFQGKNYNDPARFSEIRKDWLLYLAEGRVVCHRSGNVQADRDLVGLGYTVELVQYSSPNRLFDAMKLCPKLTATLTSYHEKHNEDGRFLFAGVVGAAQLDGNFEWSYRRPWRFWAKDTFEKKYEYMNLDERACYMQYHKQQFRYDAIGKGRYGLGIRVTHYCTDRQMRATLDFDVSIGPEQVPERIYEDTGLVIDLTEGRLIRSTGQQLCANGWEQAPTTATAAVGGKAAQECDSFRAPRESMHYDHAKSIDEKCAYDYECPFGAMCHIKYKPHCSMHGRCSPSLEKSACAWANRQYDTNAEDCATKGDPQCHDDEFCWLRRSGPEEECKKRRFKEAGEPCLKMANIYYVTSGDAECFPGLSCSNDDGDYGYCT